MCLSKPKSSRAADEDEDERAAMTTVPAGRGGSEKALAAATTAQALVVRTVAQPPPTTSLDYERAAEAAVSPAPVAEYRTHQKTRPKVVVSQAQAQTNQQGYGRRRSSGAVTALKHYQNPTATIHEGAIAPLTPLRTNAQQPPPQPAAQDDDDLGEPEEDDFVQFGLRLTRTASVTSYAASPRDSRRSSLKGIEGNIMSASAVKGGMTRTRTRERIVVVDQCGRRKEYFR